MDIIPPTRPEASAAPGDVQYQIRRLLGEGGYGQVYEAWDSKLQRSVALKRLRAQTPSNSRDRLLDEARAAASLKHTAFVKIYALDGDQHTPAIIMELIEGRSLAQLGPLAVDDALDIARQIAEAMLEAHRARLVHGDLKPSNLMLEPSGQVRILDFGLARHIDPLATQSTLSDELQGTIAYLAPERLAGNPAAPPSDVYALGVVLYQLLTGQRPFAELNGMALAAAHLQTSSEQWPYPPHLPAAVTALVQAMTATSLAMRLPSMNAVSATIRTLGADSSLTGRLGGWALRLRRRLHRQRHAWALGAGAAVLAATAWTLGARGLVTAPLSDSAQLRAGLAALLLPDRPGSLDSAAECFNAILQRTPGHAGATAGLSLSYSLRYFSDGRDEVWLQRAAAAAQQALAADGQLALAHAARAWAEEYQGHEEQAQQEARQALRLDPLNLFALWGLGDLLIDLRRFSEAAAVVEAGIAAYPQQRIFQDLRGKLAFQQGHYAQAEQAFRASLALEPDVVYAYANLHATLERENRGDEALHVLQQGLQVRPNSRLYSSLGSALFYRGDYLGAEANFTLAVSASHGSPNQYLHWANLGDALRWIPGRENDARNAYRQAVLLLQPQLDRSPANATLVSRMGLYQAKLSHRSEAAVLARRALALAPDGADIHFRAAIALEISGDRSAALEQIVQARALGYPIHLIDAEPDLLALRRDGRYHYQETQP